MNRTHMLAGAAALVFLLQNAFAQDPDGLGTASQNNSSAVPVVKESKTSSPALIRTAALASYRRMLDEAFKSHTAAGTFNGADLHLEASGRIAECEELLKNKPSKPETAMSFRVCSLAVESAVLQMKAQKNYRAAEAVDHTKDSLLFELNNLHETINGIERSHASQLKDDLDIERRKALQLQEDAERKFSELQSELIKVSKDARGTIISMSDILFDIGKASLTVDLKTSLAKIAGILMVYKVANITVEGHTDNVGSESYNQELSEARAGNVMQFLTEQGVAASRLNAVGYAFRQPIADNSTKEGRQKNRRVDLVIKDSR